MSVPGFPTSEAAGAKGSPSAWPSRSGRCIALALTVLFAGYSSAARPDALAPSVLHQSASIRADNALIAEVEVRLSRPGRVFVEYENPQAGKFRTALSESGLEHAIAVLRLRAETAYSYAIWVQDADGAAHLGQRGEFRTGSLPPDLAAIRAWASGRSSQPLILTDYSTAQNGYLLFWDDRGEIVWHYTHERVTGFAWPNSLMLAIVQKPDSNLIYLNEACCITEITPLGEVVRQLAASEEAGMPHHDFVLLDDGRILYLSYEKTIFDDSANGGEPETRAKAGALRIWDAERGRVQMVWDSRDFWDIASASQRDLWKLHDGWFHWTHFNSVSVGPQGNFILSSRHRQQILSIAADFQAIEWQLSGPDSDYGFPNPSDRFYAPHQATQLPNGNILLFDNGRWRPASEGGKYSRAIELRLDHERRSAVKVWGYRADPDIFSSVVSGAARLGNGNTLINFGVRQDLDFMPITIVEADPQGNELFRLETLQPDRSRSFKHLPWRYRAAGDIVSIHGETMLRAPAARVKAATGRFSDWRRNQRRRLHERLISGKLGAPLARSTFDIHLNGRALTYLKRSCDADDTRNMFFLHIFPVDKSDLETDREQSGFNNLDFDFAWSGEFFDGDCIAQRMLPDYPVERIRTGQYIPDEEPQWEAQFPVNLPARD